MCMYIYICVKDCQTYCSVWSTPDVRGGSILGKPKKNIIWKTYHRHGDCEGMMRRVWNIIKIVLRNSRLHGRFLHSGCALRVGPTGFRLALGKGYMFMFRCFASRISGPMQGEEEGAV